MSNLYLPELPVLFSHWNLHSWNPSLNYTEEKQRPSTPSPLLRKPINDYTCANSENLIKEMQLSQMGLIWLEQATAEYTCHIRGSDAVEDNIIWEE